MIDVKLLVLQSNTWNYLIVYKQLGFGSFKKNFLQTIHLQIIYI